MPIIALQRRLREAGRIRIGEQVPTDSGKLRPAKLDKFRFTSADKQSIMAIADLCGGEPRPWDGAPVGEQFELFADCKSLDVIVPPVDLAFSQWYELWSGGGCQRRCDGQTNVISDSPCACNPDEPECKPTSRLGVILTAVQGIGVWRLETHGWNAAAELNGAIEVLRVVQNGGSMVPARLMLEQRQSKKDGKTFNFAVPVLDLNLSVAALTGGAASMPRLASGVTPIHDDGAPLPTVADQVTEIASPSASRSNAATKLPPTGRAPRPASAVTAPSAPPAKTSGAPGDITQPQINNLKRLLTKAQLTTRTDQLEFCSDEIGRAIGSSKELTKREGMTLISRLKMLVGEEETPRPATSQSQTRSDEPPPTDYPYGEEPF